MTIMNVNRNVTVAHAAQTVAATSVAYAPEKVCAIKACASMAVSHNVTGKNAATMAAVDFVALVRRTRHASVENASKLSVRQIAKTKCAASMAVTMFADHVSRINSASLVNASPAYLSVMDAPVVPTVAADHVVLAANKRRATMQRDNACHGASQVHSITKNKMLS
jgi:hypothetical protein